MGKNGPKTAKNGQNINEKIFCQILYTSSRTFQLKANSFSLTKPSSMICANANYTILLVSLFDLGVRPTIDSECTCGNCLTLNRNLVQPGLDLFGYFFLPKSQPLFFAVYCTGTLWSEESIWAKNMLPKTRQKVQQSNGSIGLCPKDLGVPL